MMVFFAYRTWNGTQTVVETERMQNKKETYLLIQTFSFDGLCNPFSVFRLIEFGKFFFTFST